jgi:hypothetical protein
MKVKIYILFALAIFACVIQTIGQTIYEQSNNEMKYWKLRGRLIGDEFNRNKYILAQDKKIQELEERVNKTNQK